MIHIIACAHGTHSPDGRSTIDAVRGRLQSLLNEAAPDKYLVHEAYVDVQDPAVDSVLASLPAEEQAIIVPLLLSTGYHTQVDLLRAAQRSGLGRVQVAGSLGPSPFLAAHLQTRLVQAGWQPGQPVVLAGAGSSRADGRAAVAEQARLLGEELGQSVAYGFVADIEPRIGGQLAAGIFVASYLLVPGFFYKNLTRVGLEAGAQVSQALLLPGDSAATDVLARCALEPLQRCLKTAGF